MKSNLLALGVCSICIFGVANADFEILQSELQFEGDSGPDYWFEPLLPGPMYLYQDMGHVTWSGIGGDYVSYNASGGDYYSVTDMGDPWYNENYEEMHYAMSDMMMTFSITDDIKLSGFGDLGFKLDGSEAAALSSIEDGIVLSAGTYVLQVADWNFGEEDSSWNDYEENTEEGYFWDFSGYDSYSYNGGFEFSAVPAPGAISMPALVGIRSRRRR